MPMGLKTALYERHVAAGGRMVEFAGWDLPRDYGSQKDEHHAVRQRAGMFDVSHMTIIDLHGTQVREFLRFLLANDVAKLTEPGRALYSCMLNDSAGVIDDLITYYLDEEHFRVVVNAATRSKDLEWIGEHASLYDVDVAVRDDMTMIAVQGPDARSLAAACIDPGWRSRALDLAPFSSLIADSLFIARTGYTGEDGWEIVCPSANSSSLWDALIGQGVEPCGLGARDTLRLEAGMNLYGADMDESVSPLESGLDWTIAWTPLQRKFNGRSALEKLRARPDRRRFVGLLLEDRGVMRSQQRVIVAGIGEGVITSGGFAPTIGRSIALARLPAGDYKQVQIDIRGTLRTARIVETPFVRRGKVLIDV